MEVVAENAGRHFDGRFQPYQVISPPRLHRSYLDGVSVPVADGDGHHDFINTKNAMRSCSEQSSVAIATQRLQCISLQVQGKQDGG